jgi:hypothetical protein
MTIYGPPVYSPAGKHDPLKMKYDLGPMLPPIITPTSFRSNYQPAARTPNPAPQIYPIDRVDKDLPKQSGYAYFKAPEHPCPPEAPYQSGNMCFKTERAWIR